MKTLKDFFVETKKVAHLNPRSKSEQKTLDNYLYKTYNFRLKKLKEAEYFSDEWLEPGMGAKA